MQGSYSSDVNSSLHCGNPVPFGGQKTVEIHRGYLPNSGLRLTDGKCYGGSQSLSG